MNKPMQKHSNVKLAAKRACKELYPWEYTTEEGSHFKEWTAGAVTVPQLRKAKLAAIGTTTEVNGVVLHSIAFESAIVGHGCYARWDCINGWTTTIAQARKRFPRGHHGEQRLPNIERLRKLLTPEEFELFVLNKDSSLRFYNTLPLHSIVVSAFDWETSPQGHNYWREISDRIEKQLSSGTPL